MRTAGQKTITNERIKNTNFTFIVVTVTTIKAAVLLDEVTSRIS